MERDQLIQKVSWRLLIITCISLTIILVIFSISRFLPARFPMTLFCFACGLVGGFVSIQQRLRSIKDPELVLLSNSWTMITLVPIYGGIFSLLLYALFLSGLVQGQLFPEFYIPSFGQKPSTEEFRSFLTETSPKTAQDFCKFIFWCFVAGYSERFVPQLVEKISSQKGN
jgi:hypothetical protein